MRAGAALKRLFSWKMYGCSLTTEYDRNERINNPYGMVYRAECRKTVRRKAHGLVDHEKTNTLSV